MRFRLFFNKIKACGLIFFILCICLPVHAGQKASSAHRRAMKLDKQGRFQEALVESQRAVSLEEQASGEDSPELARYLDTTAVLLSKLGRYFEAEPILERSRSIREKLMGTSHPIYAVSLINLANLYQAKGVYESATPLLERALVIFKKAGAGYASGVASVLNNLAENQTRLGKYKNAEQLYKRGLRILGDSVSPDYKMRALVYNNLARLYRIQGNYKAAVKTLNQALKAQKRAWGKQHPDIALTHNNLAEIYVLQGRYKEAEQRFRKAIRIFEAAYGQDHPHVATLLSNMAGFYTMQRRYEVSKQLLNRARDIQKRSLGADHPQIAETLYNLATVHYYEGGYLEAEKLIREVLHIRDTQLGPRHPRVAKSLLFLGEILRAQKRYKEAEPAFLKSIEIARDALGSDHPDIAAAYNHLAYLYTAEGRYQEAEKLYSDAIQLTEKNFGNTHPDLARLHHGLSKLYLIQNMSLKALGEIRIATSMLSGLSTQQGEGQKYVDVRSFYETHLSVLATIHSRTQKHGYTAEAFEKSELALTKSASQALNRMAARLSTDDEKLSSLIRKRQDAIELWKDTESRLIASLSSTSMKRDAGAENDLRKQLVALKKEINTTGALLDRKYPKFAQLTNPPPVSIDAIQKILKPDEALIEYLVTDYETYLFVVTKDQAVFRHINIKREELNRIVRKIRLGLDFKRATPPYGIPRFDALASYELHQKLIVPAVPFLGHIQHLFVILDDALQSLPMGILVTEKPDTSIKDIKNYKKMAWLTKKYSITVLPSAGA